jgi:hypothetical protein
MDVPYLPESAQGEAQLHSAHHPRKRRILLVVASLLREVGTQADTDAHHPAKTCAIDRIMQ